ncbi:unnamed protein product [Amoebophrya sp. A120]|nr:unnamed protein product [Amoebophrya sp. A120]|eukprot:GSA120T00003206001.1
MSHIRAKPPRRPTGGPSIVIPRGARTSYLQPARVSGPDNYPDPQERKASTGESVVLHTSPGAQPEVDGIASIAGRTTAATPLLYPNDNEVDEQNRRASVFDKVERRFSSVSGSKREAYNSLLHMCSDDVIRAHGYDPNRWSYQIYESQWMTGLLVAVVAVNVVLIGFEAAEPSAEDDVFMFSTWWYVELVFFAIYLSELCLRLHAYERRRLFFVRGDWFNNTLDSFLIVLQIFELVASGAIQVDLGFLKMIRLARLTKLKCSESIMLNFAVLAQSTYESVFLFFLLFLLIAVNSTIVMVYRKSFGSFDDDHLETTFFKDYQNTVLSFAQMTMVDSTFGNVRNMFSEAPALGVLSLLHVIFGSIMIMNMVIGLVTDIQFRTQKAIRLQTKLDNAVALANWLVVNVGEIDFKLNSLILAKEKKKNAAGAAAAHQHSKKKHYDLARRPSQLDSSDARDLVEEAMTVGAHNIKSDAVQYFHSTDTSPHHNSVLRHGGRGEHDTIEEAMKQQSKHTRPENAIPTRDEQDMHLSKDSTQLRATQGLTIPISVFYDPSVQAKMHEIGDIGEDSLPSVVISAMQETARAAGILDDAELRSVTALSVAEAVYMRELDLGRDDVINASQETKRVRSFVHWNTRLQFLGMEVQRMVLYALGDVAGGSNKNNGKKQTNPTRKAAPGSSSKNTFKGKRFPEREGSTSPHAPEDMDHEELDDTISAYGTTAEGGANIEGPEQGGSVGAPLDVDDVLLRHSQLELQRTASDATTPKERPHGREVAEGSIVDESVDPRVNVRQGLFTSAMHQRIEQEHKNAGTATDRGPRGAKDLTSVNVSSGQDLDSVDPSQDMLEELNVIRKQQNAIHGLSKTDDLPAEVYKRLILERCAVVRNTAGAGSSKKIGEEARQSAAFAEPLSTEDPTRRELASTSTTYLTLADPRDSSTTSEADVMYKFLHQLYSKCDAEDLFPCAGTMASRTVEIIEDVVRERPSSSVAQVPLSEVLQETIQDSLRKELLQHGLTVDTQILRTKIGQNIS